MVVETSLNLLDAVDRQIGQIEDTIAVRAQALPEVGHLMSIPGVDVFSAVVILTEIGDISWFPTVKHLSSYAGLAPTVYASGDTVYTGHISKRGRKALRWVLIQVVLHAVRKQSTLSSRVTGLPACRQASPGKSSNFHPTPAPFTAPPSGGFGLRCIPPAHSNGTASNEVRVPRVGALPPASFRSRVTAGTLALGYGRFTANPRSGLSPYSHCPCRAHGKGGLGGPPLCGVPLGNLHSTPLGVTTYSLSLPLALLTVTDNNHDSS